MRTTQRDWTVEEDKTLSDLYISKKLNISEIATILNRTIGSIKNRRAILHISRYRIPTPVNKILEEKIKNLHSNGLSNVAIASELKFHRRTVESHLYRMGWSSIAKNLI